MSRNSLLNLNGVSVKFIIFLKPCLFLKKVDSILTLKINNSISVRNQLTSLPAEVDLFSWNG